MRKKILEMGINALLWGFMAVLAPVDVYGYFYIYIFYSCLFTGLFICGAIYIYRRIFYNCANKMRDNTHSSSNECTWKHRD